MASSLYLKVEGIVFSNISFFFTFTQVHTVPYMKQPEKLQEAILRKKCGSELPCNLLGAAGCSDPP